jgi:hypothetical protein
VISLSDRRAFRPLKEIEMRHGMLYLPFLLLVGCGDNNTASNVTAPGADTSLRTQVLEAGAQVLQGAPPVGALNAYLDGFHFYNGRMQGQMEAHHYCSIVNEGVTQCVIYDGNVAEAKLMGVEYIVSEALFATLPDEEKPMWHSHVFEVTSGQLVAPGIPLVAEHELMEKLIGTYGKTWHTWHTDLQENLPVGVPQLMMGFTAEGQTNPELIAARNERMGIDGRERRENRADIPVPQIANGADGWESGRTVQLVDPTGQEAHAPHGAQNAPGVAISRAPE